MGVWRFSRSHSQAYKTCPKFHYLTYCHDGTGIEPKGLSLGLSRGTLAHAIIGNVLQYIKENNQQMPPADVVKTIVTAWTDKFKAEALQRSFEAVDQAMVQTEADRQACLVEGLVRAWLKIRLPFFLENYEILEVEGEHDVPLTEEIILMSRADAEIKRKTTGEISALEFKTTSTNKLSYFESFRYSVQTMAHLFSIEQRYGQPGSSVMMEFLYCGYHKRDELTGQDVYYSPIVKGYVRPAQPPIQPTDEYGWDSYLARKKGWNPINVWEDPFGSVKPSWMSPAQYWVDHVLDRPTLEGQLFTREVFRNSDEMERWRTRAIHQQARIYKGIQLLEMVKEGQLAGKRMLPSTEEVMDQFFPGNEDENCYQNKYFKACAFLPICFNEISGDPIQSGMYVKRDPHHPREFEV